MTCRHLNKTGEADAQIGGANCTAECALAQAELANWRGRIAIYSDTLAGFPDHVCRRPRYALGYWLASGMILPRAAMLRR